MKSLSTRAAVYGLLILLGLLSALPNVLPDSVAQKMPDWYSANTLTLGLDLRGGSHLLMELDTQDLLRNQNQQLADQLSDKLREVRIAHARPVVTEDTIQIVPKDPGRLDQVEDISRELIKNPGALPFYSVKIQPEQIRLQLTDSYRESLIADAVERSLEVVRRRLDESGLVEPGISRQGSDGILVQLPGVDNPQYIRQLLGTTAKMTFHWAVNNQFRADGNVITVAGEAANESYQLEQRVALEGKHISDARQAISQETGQPVVTFKLDKEGARLFGEMTRDNIGRALAIVLDNRVITAPVIRSAIGASGEISGSFTVREAGELAILLRAGALPAPLQVIEERTVGPDLGSDTIAMGISTGLMGALLVIGFMLTIYGRWGLIACLGLSVNIGLVFGILSLLGATLTLPGIAGIILTIGMAVDANILINERIREELRRGKSNAGAVNEGFRRAYSTILDSNITTLIAVSLLFLLGSGPVRGFAINIGIGLLTSMFTAISVTRVVMEWQVRRLNRRPLQISGFKALDSISGSTINFMRGRFIGLVASAVLSLAAIFLFYEPGLKYGIDFSGGTVVEVVAPDTTVEQLRTHLQQNNFAQAAIQEFGDEGHYLMRLLMENAEQGAEQVASGQQVEALKSAVLAVSPYAEFPRVEMVGPKVSDNFTDATILAVLLAGAGMLAYLWMRFESHFALAAILTIALDLTKTIGFFVLAGVEFNLTAVAALLALIGYSINDKVVVFDRVRENLRLTPDKPLLQLLNESITSTLTRTVFTSVTTFLALVPMAVAGGSAVASFALPMLFGILIGTSSSVYIASPIVYLLGQRRLRKGLLQLRPTSEQLRRELDLIP
jgi:SecD/SecF fusion protein